MTVAKLQLKSLMRRTFPLPIKWAGTVVVVGAAYLLRAEIFTSLPPLPLLFFLPAILFCAIFFGMGFGALATALSGALATYFFLPPANKWVIESPNAALSLTLFIMTGLLISFMGSALRNAYRDADKSQAETAAAYLRANEARAQAEAGEKERELLLIEFGHRVKNDMQRTIATLNLKAAQSSPDVSVALKEAANQVNVVASMHDRLAHRDGEIAVDMADFLNDLGSGLHLSMAETRPIGLFVEAQSHTLSADRAGPVGLITNELVTNALKHAFPNDRSGRITITFTRDEAGYCLSVADDGIGIGPATAVSGDTEPRRKSMGKVLTRALAAQLGGHLESRAGQLAGTVHTLIFPLLQPGRRG